MCFKNKLINTGIVLFNANQYIFFFFNEKFLQFVLFILCEIFKHQVPVTNGKRVRVLKRIGV